MARRSSGAEGNSPARGWILTNSPTTGLSGSVAAGPGGRSAPPPALGPIEELECQGSVRDGRSRPQRGGEKRSFRDFLPGGSGLLGVPGMDIQAVRALRGTRDGEGDQLTILAGDFPVVPAHDGVELDEALELRRRQLLEFSEDLEIVRVVVVTHGRLLVKVSVKSRCHQGEIVRDVASFRHGRE